MPLKITNKITRAEIETLGPEGGDIKVGRNTISWSGDGPGSFKDCATVVDQRGKVVGDYIMRDIGDTREFGSVRLERT